MRAVDTSAWIEWLIKSDTGRKIEGSLPTQAEWIVPTIVQLELSKWLTREISEDKADQVIAFTEACIVAPLTTRVALLAAELTRQHKLSTADAIVYATALEHNADLLTCDAHFGGLPNVTLIPKKTP
jgi:predicted nucleic acid-binding protein